MGKSWSTMTYCVIFNINILYTLIRYSGSDIYCVTRDAKEEPIRKIMMQDRSDSSFVDVVEMVIIQMRN
jgi:hypothetical protein